jgi:serine/threonine protein kinase
MTIELPNYHLLEKLGVGAETRVFRARCTRTGKDYAVKIVKLTKPEDAGFIDLMRSEHAIGSVLNHPALRKVYELRMIRQRFRVRGAVLFMEYVEGVPMSDKEFRRPMDELLRLLMLAAEGLHAMHVAGYVHADLKPNNILVTPAGTVKLIDYGQSARILEPKTRVQGTIDYIAPEQVQKGVLDQRTDVFGLGAVLHRLVTGRPVPTEMNQTVSVYSQSLVGKRVSEVREYTVESLPTCVNRLIDDCCRWRPEDRIQDMPAVIERIRLARAILAKQEAAVTAGPGALDDYEDDEADAHEDDAIDSDGIALEEADFHALVSDDPSGEPPLK